MGDKNSTLPSNHTKPYLLLSLTAISGEFPITQLGRFGSPSYMDNVVKRLKRDGLLRGYYKDKHRGLRLTAKAKSLLLIDTADRFSFFITGISDTNTPKSELTRRLRLHRIAESMVTMQRANVTIFRDEKPDVFYLEGGNQKNPLQIDKPCFYNSREMKELGIAFVKIRALALLALS